jgi:pSer/pThr/pTyr-binding forkhead associated (FHA) protein
MKLVIEDEAGTRSIVPFAGDAIVVGRGADGVTFRLPERNVSRRHARFVVQSGAVYVEDLGSLNGTRVNGERIGGRRRLRDGDLVQIGDYDLAVLAEGVAVAPGAPPPLPAAGRGEEATVRMASPVDPTPPSLSPSWAAPPPPRRTGRGRAVKMALAFGMLALAIGLAVGWVAGALGR